MGESMLILYSLTILVATTVSAAPLGTVQDRSLALINPVRANYGAEALTWSPSIAADAAKFAQACKPSNIAGQLYYRVTPTSNSPLADAVKQWASTSSNYNFDKPGFVQGAASFTQLVWKSSTQVGCAWTACKSGTFDPSMDSTFVVCKFSSMGNLQSKVSSAVADPIFASNVGKPLDPRDDPEDQKHQPQRQNHKTYDSDNPKDPNHPDNPNYPDPKNPGRPVRRDPDGTPKDPRDDPKSPKYDPTHPIKPDKTYDPNNPKDPNHPDNPENKDPKNPGRPVPKAPDGKPTDPRDGPEDLKY
ncbi:hypothetical protein BGZ91_005391 [Linnemannia elongata]|nr:hypothetical protein BGZ91_005391 [Linnemannia elongata]KAG0074806.1 hypothetical protein BGZ90_010451 [Linnemannia elongata]